MIAGHHRRFISAACSVCCRLIVAVGLCGLLVGLTISKAGAAGEGVPWIDQAQLAADIEALTRHPHRLSGTSEGLAASEHVRQRLEDIGVDQVATLDMPVWQTNTLRCEIVVDGKTIPLYSVRPNNIVPPTTPEEGFTGPLIYAGKGRLVDFGDRHPSGAVVVLDFDCQENWRNAFALGAKAVVFLGRPGVEAWLPKSSGLPINQVRLYASHEDLTKAGVDLTRDRDEATVHSQVRFELALGRSVVALVRGTDAFGINPQRDEAEAMVLSASLDSFGVVPRLSPGARGAANVAALLQAAQRLAADPPRRDVVLMFLDNSARHLQGAREVYAAIDMTDAQHEELQGSHAAEQDALTKEHEVLTQHGLAYQFHGTSANTQRHLSNLLSAEAEYARADMAQSPEGCASWIVRTSDAAPSAPVPWMPAMATNSRSQASSSVVEPRGTTSSTSPEGCSTTSRRARVRLGPL